jgi:hypothetical protein
MSIGDAGEGLVDAESRLAERLEEREEEKRRAKLGVKKIDPERVRQRESLRLAKADVERQLSVTTNVARKQQLTKALADLDRQIASLA